MFRISPIFIFLFVAAAVIAAFGIHKYMRQANLSERRSLSSESSQSTEKIENIPGEWSQRNKETTTCEDWSEDGVCLSVKEE